MKVVVWAAINVQYGIVVAVLPQVNINTEQHINILREDFVPILQGLNIQNEAIFMQYNAKSHTSDVSP